MMGLDLIRSSGPEFGIGVSKLARNSLLFNFTRISAHQRYFPGKRVGYERNRAVRFGSSDITNQPAFVKRALLLQGKVDPMCYVVRCLTEVMAISTTLN